MGKLKGTGKKGKGTKKKSSHGKKGRAGSEDPRFEAFPVGDIGHRYGERRPLILLGRSQCFSKTT